MQNLSSAQKQHLDDGGPVRVTIHVDPVSGEPFSITDYEMAERSCTIERNWTTGSNIEIGCADTAELIFTLDNADGQWSDIRWEGARLTVVYHINGEPLRAGIFTVDEPPRRLSTMQIRALDNMARFNRPWVPGISFPATLFQIIQDACNQCNVTLGTLEFDNHDYVVEQKPAGDDITNHHIIAWVAELAGSNAWIDEFGRLRLSWYGDNQIGNFEISPHNMMSYDEIAEADIEITGIAYRTEEIDYILGTDEYALLIEDNPLLQNNFEAVLTVLYNKIGGFKYRPYRLEVVGYPHVWPGDIITKLIDIEGNELTSIVTNHTYRLNGNSKLAARGETETVRGYATGAPFTAAQKRVLQSVAKVEVERQTSGLEQATLHLNELMANALGIYPTVIEQETGAKLFYMHDKPTLEESMVIWHWTEQGLAWTDQGWNDGNPDWQYGVLADGNVVLKVLTALGINADWINAGRVKAEHVEIGPGTKFAQGEEFTWEEYADMTWQELESMGGDS